MGAIDESNIGSNNAKRHRFSKGNPGRPRGSRSRATVLAERLLAQDIRETVEAVQAAAKGGEMQAAQLILDRLAPPPNAALSSL
jgi:hypothetical protein